MISFSEVSMFEHTVGDNGELLFDSLRDGSHSKGLHQLPKAYFGDSTIGLAACPYCGSEGTRYYEGSGGWVWVNHACGTSTASMSRVGLLGTTVPGLLCLQCSDDII